MNEPRRRQRPTSPEELEHVTTAPPEHPVGPAIQDYLRAKGYAAIACFGEVQEVWTTCVGSEVAAHCQPRRLDGDELHLEVDHQAWSTELAFRADEIVARLSAALGKPVIRRLKVHVRTGFGLE